MTNREPRLTVALSPNDMFNLLEIVIAYNTRPADDNPELDPNLDIEQALIDVIYLYDPEAIQL